MLGVRGPEKENAMAGASLHTRLCEVLDIEHPVIAFTHCREVAVAAIRAGGFAVLGEAMKTADEIQENIRWIGHFHTAGNPGRNDMDDTQELNYAGICKAIAASGYELYVGHEFKPKGDPIKALRHAFTICDQR